MKRPSRRALLIGGAGLALVGGGVGGAIAATGSDSPSAEREAFFSDAAGRLGVSSAQVQAALKQAALDRVDAAVAAGRLTQAQAERIKQRIESRGFGFGFRHAGPHRGLRVVGEAAASYIGITTDQLRQEVQSGKSLAQVATEHGKAVSGLEDAILAAAKQRLDNAVAAGRLTSSQAQQLLDRLRSRVDELVHRAGPFGHRP
jgi:CRISPR/Cas system-associated endoribonuclease Cas2